jgi:hypothetical protein
MGKSGIARQLIAPPAAACARVIFILMVFFTESHSTTVVTLITESGIVVSADSKIRIERNDQGLNIGDKEGTKIVVIQHHLTIASIGKEFYTYRNSITHKSAGEYDFAKWIQDIQGRLPDNVSFDDFVEIVKREIVKMIPVVQVAVSGRGERQGNVNIFHPFIQYVIAGYQNGIPRLCVLEFYIDWDRKVVIGPYQVPMDTNIPKDHPVRGSFFGVQEAIADFSNRQSYAYKQAMTLCPKPFQDFISHRPVSLDESVSLARSFVTIEEHTNPDTVGGKVRVVEITPTDGAYDLNEQLPKAKHGKKAK